MLASAKKSVTRGDWQPVAATTSPVPTVAAAVRIVHNSSPAAMPPEPNSLTSSAFKEKRTESIREASVSAALAVASVKLEDNWADAVDAPAVACFNWLTSCCKFCKRLLLIGVVTGSLRV